MALNYIKANIAVTLSSRVRLLQIDGYQVIFPGRVIAFLFLRNI